MNIFQAAAQPRFGRHSLIIGKERVAVQCYASELGFPQTVYLPTIKKLEEI